MTAPAIRLTLLIAAVFCFATWSGSLAWQVRALRTDLEEQVAWTIDAARWERAPDSADAAARVRDILPSVRERLATRPDGQDALDAVESALRSDDPEVRRQAAAALSPLLRQANGDVSVALGRCWDQVTVLLFLAVAFAVGSLVLQYQRQRTAVALKTTERALSAVQDRLGRVGVGLLCIDDGDQVMASNAVARGLGATMGSVDVWWKDLASRLRRPGAVPCAVCGRPAAVGRCEVEDPTRMGRRVVEVVFGGHAHDLELGDQLVVLVRDITEQRRRQILGGVAHRTADARSLAEGLSKALSGRTVRLLRALEAVQDDLEDPRLASAIELGGELRALGRQVGMLADAEAGPCDVGTACRAATDLVRPTLPADVDLELDVPAGLMAHTRPGPFTHALLTVVTHITGACDDGRPHRVQVGARKEGDRITVEIRDDRAATSPGSVPAMRSVTQDLFHAAGASYQQEEGAQGHLVTVKVPSSA